MREERHFIFQSAAVAGEAAVRADDAVARNDDADRIPPDRACIDYSTLIISTSELKYS